MTLNPAMLAWAAALKARGFLTAILSNIGDTMQQAMERELKWLTRFDVLVWSYQLRMAKPDPAIYRYTLDKLGLPACRNALHRRSRSEYRSCRGARHEGAPLHNGRPTPRRPDRAIPRQGTPSTDHGLTLPSRFLVPLFPRPLFLRRHPQSHQIRRHNDDQNSSPQQPHRPAPTPFHSPSASPTSPRAQARTGSCAASSSHSPGCCGMLRFAPRIKEELQIPHDAAGRGQMHCFSAVMPPGCARSARERNLFHCMPAG